METTGQTFYNPKTKTYIDILYNEKELLRIDVYKRDKEYYQGVLERVLGDKYSSKLGFEEVHKLIYDKVEALAKDEEVVAYCSDKLFIPADYLVKDEEIGYMEFINKAVKVVHNDKR